MPEVSPFVAFVSACARAGLQTVYVPLEVYVEFAAQTRSFPLAMIYEDYIGVAKSAMVIRPLIGGTGTREFASADEILEFTTASKKAL